MDPGLYHIWLIVALSLLIGLGSIPLAMSERRINSGVAYSLAYFAVAMLGVHHLLSLQGLASVPGNLLLMFAFGGFWSVCWIRSGQPLPLAFLGGIAVVWCGALAADQWLANMRELYLRVLVGCITAGTLSSVWAIVYRKQNRSSSDMLLAALLGLVIVVGLVMLFAANLFDVSEAQLMHWVALASPVFLVGFGLLVTQSAILDALSELDRTSATDPLTSLLNRRAFDQRMRSAMESARRYQRPLAVVSADIDHFKSINDTWGHAAGDVVLREFAHLLARGSRAVDYAARVGGEEFVVVMPEIDVKQARGFAERMRQTVERRLQVNGAPVTASFGVAEASQCGYDIESLMNAADRALYEAKDSGRNRVEIYDK